MLLYTQTLDKLFNDLNSSKSGLSSKDARAALKKYGPNSIKVKGEPFWKKLIEPFTDVFTVVLLIAAVISFLHEAIFDGIIIIVIILISAIIYYVQKFSTERILRSLQKKNAIQVSVFRDGKPTSLDSSQLVPGDVISLSEGMKIPADARLITGSSLRVDESQLTGESVPVEKSAKAIAGEKEVYEQTNLVFQGSFVVGGEANVLIVRTGNETEFGQIAALSSVGKEKSPVQVKIDKLIKKLIIIIGSVAVATFGLALWRGIEMSEAIRFVIAVAVGAIPEGLPVAITVVLVLGMRRMAAKKALVRNMRAIETIGTLTTIATDKTGTLTKNKLTVHDVWQPKFSTIDIIESVAKSANNAKAKVHDPLDLALIDYINRKNYKLGKAMPMIVFPFDQSTAMSGNVWHYGNSYIAHIKGAPENIINSSDLTENEREAAFHELNSLTSKGYRVIAFASQKLKNTPGSLAQIQRSNKLEFAGFAAVADILRPEAKRAIKAATTAGVTVRMITGDHYETAFQIGRELGMLENREQVFDSRRIRTLDDTELEKAIKDIRVFARVTPEHKHRLLTVLKKQHITAMTGDGVNDVPALTNAHVGLSMGSGAQIAKDAGDIILLNDNFKSVVDAVAEGRTIYANIKRMVSYLLATNLGEVLVSIIALIIGVPIPLVPVQILWVNLVTDTSMVIPLGIEPGDKRNMRRPPSDPNEPLLNKFQISRILTIAIAMAVITLGFYIYYMSIYGVEYGRTIAFTVLVVMQWASALCARSDYDHVWRVLLRPNSAFYIGLVASVVLQLFIIFGPFASYMHVSTVRITDLILTNLAAFVLLVLVIEAHKAINKFSASLRS